MSRHGPLPILAYHAIDDAGAVTSTDVHRFERTILSLLDAGLRAVDLLDWVRDGRPAIDRGFAITFDDGLSCLEKVADFLAHNAVPATVFVVADRVGSDNDWPGQPRWVPRSKLLGGPEVRSLADRGFGIGSHGLSHARLDRLSQAGLGRELEGSRSAIEDAIGRPCPLLAYPYGIAVRAARDAAARNYEAAFGTRLGYASASDDPFNLPRIDAYYLRSVRAIDLLVSGLWRRRLALRRAMRATRRALVGSVS